jgi:hypothetical protein
MVRDLGKTCNFCKSNSFVKYKIIIKKPYKKIPAAFYLMEVTNEPVTLGL